MCQYTKSYIHCIDEEKEMVLIEEDDITEIEKELQVFSNNVLMGIGIYIYIYIYIYNVLDQIQMNALLAALPTEENQTGSIYDLERKKYEGININTPEEQTKLIKENATKIALNFNKIEELINSLPEELDSSEDQLLRTLESAEKDNERSIKSLSAAKKMACNIYIYIYITMKEVYSKSIPKY